MFKEILALHIEQKICLENKITDLKENHETNMQMLKESYEKQLIYEDEKYVKTKNDIFNINNDLKRLDD